MEFNPTIDYAGFDPALPVIYAFLVKDAAGNEIYVYVGKSEQHAEKRLDQYRSNVKNRLAGKPHRRGKPGLVGYRRVHHQLADAVR